MYGFDVAAADPQCHKRHAYVRCTRCLRARSDAMVIDFAVIAESVMRAAYSACRFDAIEEAIQRLSQGLIERPPSPPGSSKRRRLQASLF